MSLVPVDDQGHVVDSPDAEPDAANSLEVSVVMDVQESVQQVLAVVLDGQLVAVDNPSTVDGGDALENPVANSEDVNAAADKTFDDEKEDDDSSDEASIDDKRKKTQKAKKIRKSKDKKFSGEYIQNSAQRTQTAKRSGESLMKNIQEYEVKTGARVFFQSEYVGPNKKKTFRHGTYWEIEAGEITKAPITAEDLRIAVNEAVKANLVPFVKELGSRNESPLPSTSQSVSVFSPKKHPQANEKRGMCVICYKSAVIKDFIVYDSAWIGCTGTGAKDSCPKWVHADCLGFPGITDADVGKMPEYFCKDHMANGRMLKKVTNRYEKDPSPPPVVLLKPKRGRRK